MLNTLRFRAFLGPQVDDPVSIDQYSDAGMLPEEAFLRMLSLERKRTERSRRGFVLMLLEAGKLLSTGRWGTENLEGVLCALTVSSRETDIKGWYKRGSVIGVIFTEIGLADATSVANALLAKVRRALARTLPADQLNQIRLSFHAFPEPSNEAVGGSSTDATLYPELSLAGNSKKFSRIVKRSMDIAGSLFGLCVFSPLILIISCIIKMTSPGPILFRQQRIGQGGKRFTFLKFRSMHVANDPTIHQEYVKQLISGTAETGKARGSAPSVYKLTNDPRVTAFGRFLRRTSLDELPQLLNVLQGEMSLVGPRPPVPYEFGCYDIWHKNRLLAVKPGITGIWQVGGRSRVRFDEMVRLDLEYVRLWSPWLDLKILLRTPRAVFSGEGAY